MWQSMIDFWNSNTTLFISIAIALLVWVAFWAIGALLSRRIAPFVERRLAPQKHKAAILLLQGFRRPISIYFKVLGLCCALLIIGNWQPPTPSVALVAFLAALPRFAYKAIRISGILSVAWGLVASSGIAGLLLTGAKHKLDLHMSKSVTRFLGAVFKVVVIAISTVVLLSEMNYDINGLVAGLGLGGLTVALAAKDSAANFFGGLILVTEKPFEIGDWISAGGVEGTVEDINLRSTKIRTSPGALTTVPNANLSGSAITNWSGGMEKRRANFELQLKYESSRRKLQEFSAAVRTMLETDPEIISDSVIVRFAEFGDFSLNIKVVFYTSLPGFSDHLRIRERVNYSLMELASAHNIEFAYPTRTVYIDSDESQKAPASPANDTTLN